MSSNILSAYKKFKMIEKKAEVAKQQKFEVECKQKQDFEITDATEFHMTISNLENNMNQQLLGGAGVSPQFNLIGESKRNLLA